MQCNACWFVKTCLHVHPAKQTSLQMSTKIAKLSMTGTCISILCPVYMSILCVILLINRIHAICEWPGSK